ncbi:hypothetical protein SBY92_003011 [Candida maltosa Xu316]
MDEEYSVLLLPQAIISRIIYEHFKLNNCYLNSILPILFTCKEIYYAQNFMLFTLKPLIVGKNKKNSFPNSKLKSLLENKRICSKISTVYLMLTPKVTNGKSTIEFLHKLHQFGNLSRLTVRLNSADNLAPHMQCFPKTLTYLKLILVRNIKDASPVKYATFSVFPNLKTLKFQSLVHINWQLKNLIDIIYTNRNSLEVLEFEMINLNPVYTAMNQSYKLANESTFPRLKLIKIDQTTSYPNLQISSLLTNCQMIIYINNYLSHFIILKCTNEGIVELKFDLLLFNYKFNQIRKQLDV